MSIPPIYHPARAGSHFKSLLSAHLAAATLALSLCLLLAACATQQKPHAKQAREPAKTAPDIPTIKAEAAELRVQSFRQAELVFRFTVRNPGPTPLTLYEYDYSLDCGSAEGISDQSGNGSARTADSGKTIPAGSTGILEIPILLPLPEPVSGEPASTTSRDSQEMTQPCQMSLHLDTRYAEAGRVIPLTATAEAAVTLPRLPEFSLTKVIIPQFENLIIQITYHLQLANPNSFPLTVSGLRYSFSSRERTWDEGSRTRNLELSAGGSRVVTMPMKMNYLKAGRQTVDILVGAKVLEYRLQGSAEVQLAKGQGSPYPFSFNSVGTAAIIRP